MQGFCDARKVPLAAQAIRGSCEDLTDSSVVCIISVDIVSVIIAVSEMHRHDRHGVHRVFMAAFTAAGGARRSGGIGYASTSTDSNEAASLHRQ